MVLVLATIMLWQKIKMLYSAKFVKHFFPHNLRHSIARLKGAAIHCKSLLHYVFVVGLL